MTKQNLVVVGLGNPGKQYEKTRHNIGYLVADACARKYGITLKEASRFSAVVGRGNVGSTVLHIVKPTTYMNLSGQAVQKYMQYFHLPKEDLLVVADDYALLFDHIRVREKGSSGGHNGLKDIAAHIGQEYLRIRIGICGRYAPEGDLADYVLNPFNNEELERLPAIISRAVHIVERLLQEDVRHVMNDVNQKQPSREGEEKQT